MPNETNTDSIHLLEKYLKASLLLQLENPEEKTIPELILHRAGFSHVEIANLIGKKSNTVQKTINRLKTN